MLTLCSPGIQSNEDNMVCFACKMGLKPFRLLWSMQSFHACHKGLIDAHFHVLSWHACQYGCMPTMQAEREVAEASQSAVSRMDLAIRRRRGLLFGQGHGPTGKAVPCLASPQGKKVGRRTDSTGGVATGVRQATTIFSTDFASMLCIFFQNC